MRCNLLLIILALWWCGTNNKSWTQHLPSVGQLISISQVQNTLNWNTWNTNFELRIVGAARTQTPGATNYDVDSPSWGDLKPAPLLSAMEVTSLGHESSWSPIDPVQVSTFQCRPLSIFISLNSCLLYSFSDVVSWRFRFSTYESYFKKLLKSCL